METGPQHGGDAAVPELWERGLQFDEVQADCSLVWLSVIAMADFQRHGAGRSGDLRWMAPGRGVNGRCFGNIRG